MFLPHSKRPSYKQYKLRVNASCYSVGKGPEDETFRCTFAHLEFLSSSFSHIKHGGADAE